MPDILETPLAQVEPQVQDGMLPKETGNSSDALNSLSSIHFKLPVFEGPLDLLLHLIKGQKIDIYDIPIFQITHQYMEYVKMIKELNLEIAGEFLVMASTLIHIKSRMLLPPDIEDKEEPVEDPRAELVRRLLEYEAYKDSSSLFRKREEIWKTVYHRSLPNIDDLDFGPEPVLFEANVFDLISAFKKLLEKAPAEVIEITREKLTITDRINYIVERIESEDGIRFEDFFEEGHTRLTLIVTFLAILECVRLGLIKFYQENEFGRIWVLNPKQQADEELESFETEDPADVPV